MRGREKAFTLVEVMVVVGSLSMLAALLMPVLARCREQGRQARCISYLRQTWLAYELASQDLGIPKEDVPCLQDSYFHHYYERYLEGPFPYHAPAPMWSMYVDRDAVFARMLGLPPGEAPPAPPVTDDTPFFVGAAHIRFGVNLVCTYGGTVYRDRRTPMPFPPPWHHVP